MHMRWNAVRVQGATPTIKNHSATVVSRAELLVFGGYDGRRNHNELYRFHSESRTWTQLSSGERGVVRGRPPAGRNGHTATLAERKLVVIGGWLGSGPLAADDMHVLDLDTMTWSQPPVLGTPPGPCNMHTADYIAHLRSVLVFRGGDGREYLNDLHALQIDRMEWRRVHASGQLPVPRANHSSALVGGDQVVIFGGWDGHKRLNDVHVLDTRAMIWSAVDVRGVGLGVGGALPHPRAGMTFVRHRERIFLFGGSGPSAQCYNDLHIYDTQDKVWLDVTALPDDHQLGAMAANMLDEDDEDEDDDTENEGISHSGGGSTSSRRGSRGSLSASRSGSAHALSPQELGGDFGMYGDFDDPLAYYRGGGSADDFGGHANPNDMYALRHHEQIVVVGRGPGRRAGHTCSVLEDRKLFVFGGSYGNEYLNDMYVLDTDPPPRAMISCSVSPTQMMQQSLRAYVNSDEFSDISFLVEGRVVYAHKILLSLLSERFRGMFTSGFRESHQREIVIPEIRYTVFLRMLEYLYTGDFAEVAVADTQGKLALASPSVLNGNDAASVCEQDGDSGAHPHPQRDLFEDVFECASQSLADLDSTLELLVVADQFMLDHLKQLCERTLQHAVTVETVADVLNAANQSNALQLKAICMHFVRNHDIQLIEEDENELEPEECGGDSKNGPFAL